MSGSCNRQQFHGGFLVNGVNWISPLSCGPSGVRKTEPASVFLWFVEMAELAVRGVGDQAVECFGRDVNQGLMVATLEEQVAGFGQAILDDDIIEAPAVIGSCSPMIAP